MYADSLEEYSHIVMFDFPRRDNVANIMLVSVLQQNKNFTLCVCMTSDVYRCLLMMFNCNGIQTFKFEITRRA